MPAEALHALSQWTSCGDLITTIGISITAVPSYSEHFMRLWSEPSLLPESSPDKWPPGPRSLRAASTTPGWLSGPSPPSCFYFSSKQMGILVSCLLPFFFFIILVKEKTVLSHHIFT